MEALVTVIRPLTINHHNHSHFHSPPLSLNITLSTKNKIIIVHEKSHSPIISFTIKHSNAYSKYVLIIQLTPKDLTFKRILTFCIR